MILNKYRYDNTRSGWFWLDGQPATGNFWDSQGAPDGNNICLSAKDGKWYHTSCTADHVFVCQKGLSIIQYKNLNQMPSQALWQTNLGSWFKST